MKDKNLSHLPRYRRYYEGLSLAFQDIVSKRRRSPTLEYLDDFKESLYLPLILESITSPSCRLLDVGCGSGQDLSRLFKKKQFVGWGIDFAGNNLRRAREQSLSQKAALNWVQSAIEQMPFGDQSFDALTFSEALEHLLHPETALAEIRRILKDGGLLFITTPNRYSYFSMITDLMPAGLKSVLKRWVWNMPRNYEESSHFLKDDQVKRHVREFSPGELRSILRQSGFRVKQLKGARLAIPLPSVFDRFPWLVSAWRVLDAIVGALPGSAYLKESLVVAAVKEGEVSLESAP